LCFVFVDAFPSYVLDPHSAVGVGAAIKLRAEIDGVVVCLACAHPAKFPDAVNKAMDDPKFEAPVPDEFAVLDSLPTRVEVPNVFAFCMELVRVLTPVYCWQVLKNDDKEIKDFIQSKLGHLTKKSGGGCPFAFASNPLFLGAVAAAVVAGVYWARSK
jgi:hypothetical protein